MPGGDGDAQLDQDSSVTAIAQMFRIRAFEEQVAELYALGEISGLVHLGIGQEAIAVGTAMQLSRDDVVVAGHRAHAHALAKGADPQRLFAELAGRENGYCGGRGGSMHIAAPDVGFLTATGIVAQNIPLAIGAAWALQLDGGGHVAVAPFGDGAAQSGSLHESLNLAALWQLPVVFVCENNGFAEFTPLSSHTTVKRLSAYADVYEIPAITIDGNDLVAVANALRVAVDRARADGGPTFVEAITYRIRGHYEGDSARYRDRAELALWRERDPIARVARSAVQDGFIDEATVNSIERDQRAVIEEAARAALATELADPDALLRWVVT